MTICMPKYCSHPSPNLRLQYYKIQNIIVQMTVLCDWRDTVSMGRSCKEGFLVSKLCLQKMLNSFTKNNEEYYILEV